MKRITSGCPTQELAKEPLVDDCEHESLVQVDVSPALNFSTTVDLFGIISVSAGSGEGIHLLHPTHSNRDGLRPRFAVAWIRICMYVIFAHGDHPKEEVLPYGQENSPAPA